MQKQNMNWFATVLRVVICFIILTDLTEFSVEVLCGWSVRWSRRSRCEKKEERQELKLGDARGTPSKYSRRLKRLSLGMPRKASPLSSTSIGMFSDSFRSCDMCNLGASFAFSFNFFTGTSNGSDSFWTVFLYKFFIFPNFGRIFQVSEVWWMFRLLQTVLF